MDSLRYPIGKFDMHQAITVEQRQQWLRDIADCPARLAAVIDGLTPGQLDTPYRPGGWTVRQVVHHLPDSHLNSYVRFKLALTEDAPTIKSYREDAWADLVDYQETPVTVSLNLLEALHKRWVVLMQSMSEADFERVFQHPESGVLTLNQAVGLYAWHSKHHVAQIAALRTRMKW